MGTIIIFGLLAGLDNLQITPALGALPLNAARRLALAAMFGCCEGLMPLVGMLAGQFLRRNFFSIAEWSGPLTLLACGGVMIFLAWREQTALTAAIARSNWLLVGLPVSMSLDNFCAGVGLGAAGYPALVSALVIGSISGALCLIGLFCGQWLRRRVPEQMELASGFYLILIAVVKLCRETA